MLIRTYFFEGLIKLDLNLCQLVCDFLCFVGRFFDGFNGVFLSCGCASKAERGSNIGTGGWMENLVRLWFGGRWGDCRGGASRYPPM